MANVEQGNSYYIDTTGALKNVNYRLSGVVLTPTSANAVLLLKDHGDSKNKMDLRAATSGESKFFDFSSQPVTFPNGIYVKTLTNCVALLIFKSGND